MEPDIIETVIKKWPPVLVLEREMPARTLSSTRTTTSTRTLKSTRLDEKLMTGSLISYDPSSPTLLPGRERS